MYKPVSQRKKVSYKSVENRTKTPFDATKTGIAVNTVKGVLGWVPVKDNPYLKVGKDILQQIARSVATVGITAGNLPTKIASKITRQDIAAPFDEEINTKDNKISKAIFGEKPVKTVHKSVEDTKKILEPYIGETASKFSAAPLVGLGLALDLSGFGGKAKVAIKGEVPETFLRLLAKKKNITQIKNILKKVGLDDMNAKSLSESLAKTKTVNEVKEVLGSYKPVSERIPLNEIIKKEPVINQYVGKETIPGKKLVIPEIKSDGYLYHGTYNRNIEKFKQEGFNPRRSVQGQYGRGTYVSNNPFDYSGNELDTLIRVKRSDVSNFIKDIPDTKQSVISEHVSPEKLEISLDKGKTWKPLVKKEPIKPVEKESNIEDAIFQEAKKYKSADEFVKAQKEFNYQGSKDRTLNSPVRIDGIRASELNNKTLDEMISGAKIRKAYNKDYQDAIDILKNDSDKITIYRALPKGQNINYKDYVSLTENGVKQYLKESTFGNKLRDNYTIVKKIVNKKDLVQQGKGSVDFAYIPKDFESQLTDIWNKAQTKTGSRIGKEITVEAPNADPITGIVERRPLNSIKPSQSGEDLFNSTSRSYARGDIVENMYTENERPINVGKLTDPEKLPPIVIDEKGNIIDGNHRWAAAKMSGLKDIDVIVKKSEVKQSLLPTVIQGETFTLGQSKTTQTTLKERKLELEATQKEIKNAQIAAEKAAKLEAKEQKIREDAIANLQRFRGNVENIKADLQKRNLSEEDLDNIILEDGTKLNEAIKVKRNSDGTLSDVITQKEIDDLKASYTDEIPKNKWQKRNVLVDGKEVATTAIQSLELPYAYFERKGLSSIYDQVIKAGRDSEVIKNRFIQKFKDAGLFKEASWFTSDRFNIDEKESKAISEYYLGRQGKGKQIELSSLSENSQKFIKVFDEIINETTEPFYQMASKMGKQPGVVENYAPLMTAEDIKLIDQGGSQDWLFRKHPAFSALKERVKNAPKEVYEKDYRKVATRWLDGMSQFLGMSDTTNHLKYLIGSDEFQNIIKDSDQAIISKWLQDITTPKTPDTLIKKTFTPLSQLLRKGVAMGSLGLNYATVLKQALTQIPIMIIEKSTPKMSSEYAKAFGIDVKQLPSISKRKGDIAIQDLQGKISRIFTGPITQFDKLNAQTALNGFLDKEYNKYLKEGVEIAEETRKLIEKTAQDKIDMWFAGFFKGQRPEAYREEIGNFILMFTYPLTSQTNGFFRHILKAKGFTGNIKAVAEVLASVVGIAYMENVIENLSPQWSDEQKMTEDILLSLSGNIPLAGNIAYSIATEQDINLSPVIGNVNNIVRAISKGDGEKIMWTISETAGLPKQARRIKEGMKIMDEGGITDNNGKMLAPVKGAMEYIRAFLRGKYGPLASQDYIRNVGAKKEDKRWFYPEVEFLQTGNYERKAEIYKTWDKQKKKEFYDMLSEGQQKKLDNAIKGITPKSEGKKSLSDIFK